MDKERITPARILIYLAGIIMLSLGIVLCKKCNMGISPISSIPYVLEEITSLTFGNLTTLFLFVNTGLQMLLLKDFSDIRLWMQVPLAVVSGWVIDLISGLVNFDGTVLAYQVMALIFSVFFTALGMVCMISMNLIQNPPDGFVRQLSIKFNKELGAVKIRYDISCVIISVSIGLIFLHKIKGFGVATIVSAIFVGKTVTWIKLFIQMIRTKNETRKRAEAAN
ncbi:MAG: YitT family protein [Lachnospiraceae bacterium]